MKAVSLLQVAAHADGRTEVVEGDCLLLEHVFGQRPADAAKVGRGRGGWGGGAGGFMRGGRTQKPRRAHPPPPQVRARVLDAIGADPGLVQAELVLLALYGRAARALSGGAGAEPPADVARDAADVRDLVRLRHASLTATLDAGFPELRSSVWLSSSAARAAAQALAPPLEEARDKAADLLREATLMLTCLEAGRPGVLERVLPKRAKQYAKGVAERA